MTVTQTPATRLRSIADDLPQLAQYLRLEGWKLACLLGERRPGAAVGSTVELLTGHNPYYEYRLEEGRYQSVSVGEHELIVDTADAGISRTLLAYGVHEYRSTTAYERELERLASDVDGPVRILEVGANIGYFCLVAAGVLGDRVRIYAIEPIPSNADLLERNLDRNGYGAQADVERLAFGAAKQSIEMELSTHSNQHRVCDSPTSDGGGEADRETISVEQTTGNRYLETRNVDSDAVHVVRFDVEGYEREVLDGLSNVLEAPGPTVVYLELHPLELAVDAQSEIVDRFEDNGFEVVSAVWTDAAAGVVDERRWHGLECDVDEFDDLRRAMSENDHSIELIVRKE
ncbi:FkbM family methyltransferase [Natronolimnohabitans sp. A-GB9]|uniref:FkbM family methyltransferase n=1 Tax=Natronolimnohabitans sp. A-GB9 TaxID=3069757 RepID=UPI0027ADE6B5|nr:FkbM family methyltransferase [Natronolimnohabitans sp. A-GB9]MDQ2051474.1 FkbM family methyltransferase [Natronolimnohabitans sp. A-GB9]